MTVRALTIRQPHASLVAVRAKTIETRSKPTSYRGPLLIHAGKAEPERRMRVGEWSVYGPEQSDERWRLTRSNPDYRVEGGFRPDRSLIIHELPFGAVVTSCQLIDCVPIVVGFDPRPEQGSYLLRSVGGLGRECLGVFDENGDGVAGDLTDQMPFGDFTPGRYAWLLDDVKPTTERCPRCWGSGFDPDAPPTLGNHYHPCPPCDGNGRCAPIPMRGRQGLWTPSADDWGPR